MRFDYRGGWRCALDVAKVVGLMIHHPGDDFTIMKMVIQMLRRLISRCHCWLPFPQPREQGQKLGAAVLSVRTIQVLSELFFRRA